MSNLETHVTSLQQSKRLAELGFNKDKPFKESVFRRELTPTMSVVFRGNDGRGHRGSYYPAYLLSEIMEALPDKIETDDYTYWLDICKNSGYVASYESGINSEELYCIRKNSPVTAACDLLIWCIENGFISTK